MAEADPAPGSLPPPFDLLIGGPKPLPDASIGRLRSLAWVCLVLSGIVMIAFSVYMAIASVEQRNRIARLDEQTRMLRETLRSDHDWQVAHYRVIAELARSIRDAADRNKALIVSALKKLYGWSDSDVDAAIRTELGSARRRPVDPAVPPLDLPADVGVPAWPPAP